MKLCKKLCDRVCLPRGKRSCKDRQIRLLRKEKAQLLRALSMGIKYEVMTKEQRHTYARMVRRDVVKAVDGGK